MKMASRSIDLISKKKQIARAAHFFFLISKTKKTNLHVQHAFCLFLHCFAQLQRCFAGPKRQTS